MPFFPDWGLGLIRDKATWNVQGNKVLEVAYGRVVNNTPKEQPHGQRI